MWWILIYVVFSLLIAMISMLITRAWQIRYHQHKDKDPDLLPLMFTFGFLWPISLTVLGLMIVIDKCSYWFEKLANIIATIDIKVKKK